MSLSVSVSPKRTGSSLLAGRVLKRPKRDDGEQLQEAAVQLLDHNLNLCSLFREAGNPDVCNVFCSQKDQKPSSSSGGGPSGSSGLLLACELRRQAVQLDISVPLLSARMVLERLKEITEERGRKEEEGEMLTSSQRVQLCVLMESSRDLLSHGALCPKLLWQEYRRDQKLPNLEVVFSLHLHNVFTLRCLIGSEEDVRWWLLPRLKALCGWTAPREDEETKLVQRRVLNAVAGVLVETGFDPNPDPAADSRLCGSILDHMISWVLDVVDGVQPARTGAELWSSL